MRPLLQANDRFLQWLDARASRRVLFAIGWTAAYFLVVLALVDPAYRVTDNTGILQMAREGYEAPFMSQILVRTFTLLYQGVSDDVPWFGLTNYASLFWSLALLIHAMSVLPQLRQAFVPLTVLASLLWTTFLIRCGYNSSSMLLTGVALLAFVAYARERRATLVTAAVCGSALAFAFLFRPRGMQGATLWIAPALVAFGALRRDRYSIAALVLFLAPISVIATVHTVWDIYWTSDEYNEFRRFNRKRGKFHVYPIMKANEGNETILEVNDWNENHYTLLINWFFFDENRYNLETITNIFEHSVELPGDRFDVEVFGKAFGKLADRYPRFLTLLALFAVGVALTRSRRVVLWSAGYVLYLVALVLYMTIALRFPGRVGDPLFTLAFFAGVWILASAEKVPPIGARFRLLALIAWLATTVFWIGHTSLQAADTARRRANYDKIFAQFNRLFRGKYVYMQPALVGAHNRSPFRNYDPEYHAIPTGWRTFSPSFYDFLEEHGIGRGSDIIPFAVDNPDFLFLISEWMYPRLLTFVKSDYGMHCLCRTYDALDHDQRYMVAQFITDPEGKGYHFRRQRILSTPQGENR